MKLGYDLYKCDELYLYTLLRYVHNKHIGIYKLKYHHHMYYFYCSVFYRYKLSSLDYIDYIGTIGLLKYILYSISISKLIPLFSFIISLIIFNNMIIRIDILGNNININKQIYTLLEDYHINKYNKLLSYEQLYYLFLDIKKDMINDIEYLNIYQKGNVFCIEYTKKDNKQIKNINYNPYIAFKDGLICKINIKSGNIRVKVNDYVHKGDILVDNTLLSTSDKLHKIPVEGEIYAYTFAKYNASISHYKDESDALFCLLLNIRSQIPVSAYIDKENVLQITKSDSKIEICVQYTLIENIAYKGERNEGSH